MLYSTTPRTAPTTSSLTGAQATSSSTTALQQPPLVISRHAWQQYQRTVRRPAATPTPPPPDPRPWPPSVLYTGYTLAALLVPYVTVWCLLSNASLRSWLLGSYLEEEDVEIDGLSREGYRYSRWIGKMLRHHFGTPDPHQISYADLIEGPPPYMDQIPRVLREEPSRRQRQREAHLQQLLQQPDWPVRIQWTETPTTTTGSSFRDHDSDEDVNTIDSAHLVTSLAEAATYRLPGNIPARPEAIWAALTPQLEAQHRPSSSSRIHHLALSFPDQEDTNTSADPLLGEEEAPVESAPTADPLRARAQVYSWWHYMNPVLLPAGATASPGVQAERDEQARQYYQDQLIQLQQELSTGRRPLDDVQDDIRRAQTELRRLQWKKWQWW